MTGNGTPYTRSQSAKESPVRALRNAASGIHRALAIMTRTLRARSTPAPRDASQQPLGTIRPEVAETLDAIDTLRHEAFTRTLSRYSRGELAQVGADVAAIPGAAESVADRFDQWEGERVARAQRSANAAEERSETASDVNSVATRLLALVPQILRRTSVRVLRPLSPRAPAPACLA